MNKQIASRILVQASQSRRARVALPARRRIEVQLGHLIHSQTEVQDWNWFVPGRQIWEETYQAEEVSLPLPTTGTATLDLMCGTCGDTVTVMIRSRAARLTYYVTIATLVLLGALIGYAIGQTLEFAFWTACTTFYLATFQELTGLTDHHSALRIVQQSKPCHRVWQSGSG